MFQLSSQSTSSVSDSHSLIPHGCVGEQHERAANRASWFTHLLNPSTLEWTLIASSPQVFLLYFHASQSTCRIINVFTSGEGMPLPALGNPEAFNCWVTPATVADAPIRKAGMFPSVLTIRTNTRKRSGCYLSLCFLFGFTCFTWT